MLNHLEGDAGCLVPARSVVCPGNVESQSQRHLDTNQGIASRAERQMLETGLINSCLNCSQPLLFRSLLEPVPLLFKCTRLSLVSGSQVLPFNSSPSFLVF